MSVLERRFCCPASMRLEEGRPSHETEYSLRGTGLHAAAAEALEGGQEASGVLPDDVDGQDIIAPWLALVRAAHELLGGELLVEHQFSLAALHDLYWGTADAVIVSPPALWVGDLKTGGGHPVPVRRPDGRPNFQLAGYALGVLQSLPQGTRIETVTLCVSQPRRSARPCVNKPWLSPRPNLTMSAPWTSACLCPLCPPISRLSSWVASCHMHPCSGSGSPPSRRMPSASPSAGP
jgi:hypothetical protein